MNQHKKVIFLTFITLVVLLIVAGVWVYLVASHFAKPMRSATLTIRGQVFKVALAETIAQRAQGLSGSDPLSADAGMYFIFPIKANYGFWMKDMKFPLDIVWITDNTVVGVSKNVPAPAPGTNILSLPSYYPPGAVNRVLEVDAGTADRLGIVAGDTVALSL